MSILQVITLVGLPIIISLLNRLKGHHVGNKAFKGLGKFKEVFVYGFAGVVSGTLFYLIHGGAVFSLLYGLAVTIGFIAFRQPGTHDIAFAASTLRTHPIVGDTYFIQDILLKLFNVPKIKRITGEPRIQKKIGIITGTGHGVRLFILAILIAAVKLNPLFILLGFVGLLYGYVIFFTGMYGGIWKKERGVIERSEYAMGALIGLVVAIGILL